MRVNAVGCATRAIYNSPTAFASCKMLIPRKTKKAAAVTFSPILRDAMCKK